MGLYKTPHPTPSAKHFAPKAQQQRQRGALHRLPLWVLVRPHDAAERPAVAVPRLGRPQIGFSAHGQGVMPPGPGAAQTRRLEDLGYREQWSWRGMAWWWSLMKFGGETARHGDIIYEYIWLNTSLTENGFLKFEDTYVKMLKATKMEIPPCLETSDLCW